MEDNYPNETLNRLCIERDEESTFAYVVAAESPLRHPDRAEQTRADYELIVRAVNSFDALVDAVRFGKMLLDGSVDPVANADRAVAKFAAALSLAEEGKQ